MLTDEQRKLREDRVTASFAPQLMAGDEAAIYNKWLELIGSPEWKADDMANIWPVAFGEFCEQFVLDWHQKKTGQELSRRGRFVPHPEKIFCGATLDAFREATRTVLDAKVIGAHRRLEEACRYYTPQLIVQLACEPDATNAALLIVHGGGEPQEIPVEINPDYQAKVWQRIDQFWHCVETFTPPVQGMFAEPVIPPERWRSINLDNEADRAACNWAPDMIDSLDVWKVNETQAALFVAAKDRVKEILPADVGKVTWSGLTVSRARNNAVTIRHGRTT
jgi:hypothetical protein